jgi:hypothetical protein
MGLSSPALAESGAVVEGAHGFGRIINVQNQLPLAMAF